ncbi:MAG: hypothetical protein H0T45_15945 [Pyrinomonadaceae bacterium]|nr:hypothetical protein [Pyrinomonadaceae bacterium]MDQ3135770.1 hypothetical protein [Acidobacteriota bacterium]
MSATLEKAIEEARTLSPVELQQLRALLDSLLAKSGPAMTEDEFEAYLAAKGIIAPVNRSNGEDGDDEEWEPNMVTGQPLSEMIIEERW